MGFLHLWAVIAGVAALGLPIAVHFLTRPRQLKLGLSTLRFVQEVVKERRSRQRLRDALILLCRVVAVGLIAMAFARPMMGGMTGAGEKASAVQRVVILDTSASMGAVSHGVPAFERARGTAARFLEEEAGLKADLVFAGARARAVFPAPSANVAALREELGRAQVRPEKLNLQQALVAAGDLFAAAQGTTAQTRREVIIISDLERTNWGGVDFSVLPTEAHIQIEPVAPPETPANLAVTDVNVKGAAAAGAAGRVEVELANYSNAARTVAVEVTLDERVFRGEKLCAAGARTKAELEVTFGAKGWHLGTARLVDVNDALPADNVRSFVVHVRAAPTYLLISRDGNEPRATSSHFLERALAPAVGGGAKGGERVIRSGASDVEPQLLAEADCVVLDHPGRLETQAIAQLAGSLRRGKSILYVVTDAADAVNLQALVNQAGTDLRMPVEFLPPTAGGGRGGIRKNLSIAEVQRTHPVFAAFGETLQPMLDAVKFTACLNSRPLATGLADDVLATYSDRSACLVATDCGQGTLIVWNADLADSNIVSTGMFVPLVGELASRLRNTKGQSAVDCGEPGAVVLDSDAGNVADLTIVTPSGAPEGKGRIIEEHGSLIWRMESMPVCGVYKVMKGGVGGQVVGALASCVPSEEADLSALTKEVLTGRLSGGREIVVHTVSADSGREGDDRVWVWCAVGAVLALLAEVAVLRIFKT